MTNYIYAYKNKKSGNFGKPLFEVVPEESAVEAYTIAIKEAPASEGELLKELELYFLGKFDTKSGVVEPVEPVFLLDCGTVRG